jgi:hypothetical protein
MNYTNRFLTELFFIQRNQASTYSLSATIRWIHFVVPVSLRISDQADARLRSAKAFQIVL